MDEYRIELYKDNKMNEWDNFVLNKSVNGTFLQTKNFLGYHPRNKFEDASLMVYHKNELVAVMPACKIKKGEKIELYSHKGSTYGGIIVKENHYKTERLINIVKTFDEYFSKYYNYVLMKITSDIHSLETSDLLQYALSYCGFNNYVELNTYIDLNNLCGDIKESFDRNKIRNIKKCEKHGLKFRELQDDDEIDVFHELLKINLSKYGVSPIHTATDMKLFKKHLIPDNIKFYGVFKNEMMMAGGMMFVFEKANVIHAQNLVSNYHFNEYSPITYLYYCVINQAKKDGYNSLSWGISTEDNGKEINVGLIRNKESYGSRYQLNRTYYKKY